VGVEGREAGMRKEELGVNATSHPSLPLCPLSAGIILFVLRPILIPFAVSLLFYYLLQPVVNALNKVGGGEGGREGGREGRRDL